MSYDKNPGDREPTEEEQIQEKYWDSKALRARENKISFGLAIGCILLFVGGCFMVFGIGYPKLENGKEKAHAESVAQCEAVGGKLMGSGIWGDCVLADGTRVDVDVRAEWLKAHPESDLDSAK